MKPINEMTLPECLDWLRNLPTLEYRSDAMFYSSQEIADQLADRIESLTRWIPVEERLPTEEHADKYGLVLKWDSFTESVDVDSWNDFGTHRVHFTHWKRIDKPEGV